MKNETMMQYFEWYLPEDAAHWKRCIQQAKELSEHGITFLWLPPAYKGQAGIHDVGYGVYDTYDLGEFDQKGSVPTKYGTKEEYIAAVRTLQKEGIKVLADIVLNHRMGADQQETVMAAKENWGNRFQDISGEQEVHVWTKFTFPGRKGIYSDFQWNWTHFDGTDWDEERKEKAIFRFHGKEWDLGVDEENGNYDYLMGDDLDMGNPQVSEELERWGKWYLDVTEVDGMRLDAVKHIDCQFFCQWLGRMREYRKENFFAVGEYWSPDHRRLLRYLNETGKCMQLFDVPLHFRFHEASCAGGNFDMRYLLHDTLTAADSWHAVTFVDNHDTQPGQALQSFVMDWFKPLAYGIILLQEAGIPCVFYGDYYGIPHNGIGPVTGLQKLLKLRKSHAYGPQHSYYDHQDIVGFTREGLEEQENSGLALLISDGPGGSKKMYAGKRFAGRTFGDAMEHCSEKVCIDEEGYGNFRVEGGSISVWIPLP
ncbi:MAG: alpha-amylase [Lachnospiraceae bacterium]|nr:alpha-amylase [Lachnospiraceae bacterium]